MKQKTEAKTSTSFVAIPDLGWLFHLRLFGTKTLQINIGYDVHFTKAHCAEQQVANYICWQCFYICDRVTFRITSNP